MLPNRLISQKPGGIMLFFALSEAIHCQKKRRPKIRFPVHPMIFQAFTSTAASCKIAKRDCMRRYRIESFLPQLPQRPRPLSYDPHPHQKPATPKNLEVAGVIPVGSLITTAHDRLRSSREAGECVRRSTAGIEAPDEDPVERAGLQVLERKAGRGRF